MFARKSLLAATLLLAACSSPTSIMKPDCHSCTTEAQEWKDFKFAALSGSWKGSVERLRNERVQSKKVKSEQRTQLRFVNAAEFFTAQKAACASVPAEALVLNGVLWDDGRAKNEFEAFLPVEDGNVAYGRISIEQVSGQRVCQYRRLGRVMGKNRLALPTVSFSESASLGRNVASADRSESNLSLEFLRFAPEEARSENFAGESRRPASAAVQEKPPLMIRVFKVSSRDSQGRGQWKGTEEYLYRLWRAE